MFKFSVQSPGKKVLQYCHTALFGPMIITRLLARVERLTLGKWPHPLQREKKRMVAAALELPASGYALEVDGRMKTEFQTRDGARAGAKELKKRFPMLQIKIYDAQTKTREEIEPPAA